MPADAAAKELLDGLIAGNLDDAAQRTLLARAGIPERMPDHKTTADGHPVTGSTRSYFEMGQAERIGYLEQTCDFEEYLLKPMNCPHHIQIYAAQPRSYRELPLRLAEFGTVYRYEQSGELSGLTRVRGFTQDDAHLFCTHEQVRGEFRSTMEMTQFFLDSCLGLSDYRVRLSRSDPDDPKYQGAAGDIWRRAESDIRSVLDEMSLPYDEAPGEAAFYGPKADFIVRDCIGRQWQLGTVQLDYVLPERFGLQYIGPDNQPHRPVMIHRAPLGSMERFMGILIEHFAGAFPLWLAPEQVRVLPISEKVAEYAQGVHARLLAAGLRATLDCASREDRCQDPRCAAREDPGDAGGRCQGGRDPGGVVPRPPGRRPGRDAARRRDRPHQVRVRQPARPSGPASGGRAHDRGNGGRPHLLIDESGGHPAMSPATERLPDVPIGYADILAAAERIAPWVHRTPVLTSRTLDERCGGNVFLKCENLQRVGAFKFRGAVNALLQLDEKGRRTGVVTHSSGNHAQALALAGQLLGVPVTVVMPRTAPAVKRQATEGYGARIVTCEPTLASRESTVADEIEQHGSMLVHPFNDWNVIAGQGTAALELIDQAGPLDMIFCPTGGGGLLSGTALAAAGKSPRTKVVGAEPRVPTTPAARSRPARSSRRTTRRRSPTACAPRWARTPSP